MKRTIACGVLALVPVVGAAGAQEVKASRHTLVAAADLNWGEPPPVVGDTLEGTATKKLPAGGYALLPADMRHFAIATTAVVVQVSGAGPFALTYVNPADDPTKRAARK